MSNYTKTTDFEAKDSLPTGDSGKIIRGSEFETEFDAISTAIATKADTAGPTFTGTATFATTNATTVQIGGVAITSTAAELNTLDGITSTTAELNKLDGFTGTVDDLNYAKDLRASGVTAAEFDILDGLTATAAELNILDGATVTTAELNLLDGVTSTTAELNILDGVTATATEINLLDGVTATTAELNILDGVTATATELNLLDGVTATTAELNILDGVTSTATELNILDGVTATTAELNIMDGVTATTTELNYVDGVTSAIQTQIDTKAPTASPTFTGTVTVPGLTTTADVTFGDNDKAVFGAGSDLQIYHDGSHSRIDDAGTGKLILRGNDAVEIHKYTGEYMITAVADGAVSLYHDDTARLATTSTGIDVTGTVTSDGLTVDGTVDVNLGSDGSNIASLSGASAGRKLDIQSFAVGASAGAGYSINATSGQGELDFQTTGNSRLNIDAGGDISFYEDTGTTAKFFWDASAESLGIGTSSPSSVLTAISGSSADETVLTVGNDYSTADAAGDASGLMFQLYRSYTPSLNDAAFIKAEKEQAWDSSGDRDSALTFGTRSGGIEPTERMRIDSSGNVGIGTSSPNSNGGSNATVCHIHDSGTGAWAVNHYTNGTTGAQTSDGFLAGIVASDAYLYNYESGNIIFGTSNDEAMRLDASGALGLGTTPPTTSTHPQMFIGTESVILGSSSGALDIGNNLYYNSGWKYRTTGAATLQDFDASGNIVFYRAASGSADAAVTLNESMRINTSGNVGIGTSSVAETLVLNKAANNNLLRFDINGTAKGYIGTSSLTNGVLTGSTAGDLNIRSEAGLNFGAGGASNIDMRLDSSGNLLVAKTSTNTLGTVGHDFGVTGYVMHTRASSNVLYLNRTTDDGNIAEFYKDGTTVGSIGAYAGDVYIAEGDTGLRFNADNDLILPFNGTSGSLATRDAAIDLGASGGRFKDLYLSGSAFVDTQLRAGAGSASQPSVSFYADSDSGMFRATTNALGFSTGGSERARINSSGALLIGLTSANYLAADDGIQLNANGTARFGGSGTSARNLLSFVNGTDGTPAEVGFIQTNGSATSYSTSSDQRLKENIVDAPSASDDIDAIQVRSFDWKADGSHQKYGMVAQELQSVAPEAVTGDADSDDMMGVDYSKLVPMLVKEIQSLRARVAQLEGAN